MECQDMSLKGRVVIITGAAGNLGRAVAAGCARADAAMVLVDRSDRLDTRFGESLAGPVAGVAPLLLPGFDLTLADAAHRMATRTLDHFGRIDGLVHTVGGFRGGVPVHQDAADTLDVLIDMNLCSAGRACRAVLPSMIGQHFGRIVTIGAAAGLAAPAGLAAYAAAKAGLIRYTEGLAQDVRRDGITANCVLPTLIDTPENRAAMPGADRSLWVAPEAIADLILFLLSDRARAVTGAAIAVPGVA
jgi:NAD(P)-dependent dehydrogenase (short-subunit alcohol dehydrogenase family)